MEYKSNILKNKSWCLEIDLISDLNDLAYEQLLRNGYKNIDKKRSLYQFYNVQKRLIANRPRKIHKSREFFCPKGYEKALQNFEQKVLKGESVLPFLSKKILNASYNDAMLNDWGIYHFHLTNRFEDDGWAKRSDYQMFAYVTATDMYFIKIYAHKTSFLYSQQEIIKIIYYNWPELIERYRLKGIDGLSEKISDEQYNMLRKANVSTFVELENKTVFGLIGGGYMSDGSSSEAMRASDYWQTRLRRIEEIIVSNMELLCEIISQISESEEYKYKMKLLWIEDEDIFTFCELSNQVIVQLNLRENWWRACEPCQVFGFKVL